MTGLRRKVRRNGVSGTWLRTAALVAIRRDGDRKASAGSCLLLTRRGRACSVIGAVDGTTKVVVPLTRPESPAAATPLYGAHRSGKETG